MELEDIRKAQEDLVEEAHEYFGRYYEAEEEFRRKFTGESEEEEEN